MTGLNWFQARAIGLLEKRAVRRVGWTKWLLYRSNLWLVSVIDGGTGAETRRVATNGDFTDAEFLAKDWTDETWEGGSYPPCTSGPGTAVPGSDTGGAGAWTLTAACAGDGDGGGVQPPEDGGGSGPDDDGYAPPFTLELDPTGLGVTPDGGGGTCWTPSHPSTVVFHALFQDLDVVSPDTISGRGWIAPHGVDLTGPPDFSGVIVGATGPATGTFSVNILEVTFPAVSLVPGRRYDCRVDAVYSWGGAYTAFASFTLAAACP